MSRSVGPVGITDEEHRVKTVLTSAGRREGSPRRSQNAICRAPSVQASLDQRQRFQQLFFPDGIAFDGNRFVGTGATAPAFSYLWTIEIEMTGWWTRLSRVGTA